jgi:hypothetical protein
MAGGERKKYSCRGAREAMRGKARYEDKYDGRRGFKAVLD